MTDDNKLELYKTILEQEVSNHNIFITVLLGIVIIIIGSTWWWNKHGALKEIEKEVEKKLKQEKKKNAKKINKKITKNIQRKILEYEQKVSQIEGDVARSIAISANKDEHYSHSVYWWSRYLENSIKTGNQIAIRNATNYILGDLESLKANDEGEVLANIHLYESVVETIEKLPEILSNEKKEILKICKGRDKEDI